MTEITEAKDVTPTTSSCTKEASNQTLLQSSGTSNAALDPSKYLNLMESSPSPTILLAPPKAPVQAEHEAQLGMVNQLEPNDDDYDVDIEMDDAFAVAHRLIDNVGSVLFDGDPSFVDIADILLSTTTLEKCNMTQTASAPSSPPADNIQDEATSASDQSTANASSSDEEFTSSSKEFFKASRKRQLKDSSQYNHKKVNRRKDARKLSGNCLQRMLPSRLYIK
ncbi:hypothetical protein BC829DRAFT_442773 [Chytridium lagenaria]|nr:hypothetical protein BC829DRAFT_442773 [Chytridium lagenaria]